MRSFSLASKNLKARAFLDPPTQISRSARTHATICYLRFRTVKHGSSDAYARVIAVTAVSTHRWIIPDTQMGKPFLGSTRGLPDIDLSLQLSTFSDSVKPSKSTLLALRVDCRRALSNNTTATAPLSRATCRSIFLTLCLVTLQSFTCDLLDRCETKTPSEVNFVTRIQVDPSKPHPVIAD